MMNSDNPSSKIAVPGAVALMVTAITQGVVGFVLPAVNLIILLATGATPNEIEGPRSNAVLQWRGQMPIEVPWWIFLLFAISLGVLLVITRRDHDQFGPARRGALLLWNTPVAIGFWAAIGALMALGTGLFTMPSGYGLYWIPALFYAVVVVAAGVLLWRGFRNPTQPKDSARVP